ncbi:MAG TPA: insulinase family protein [Puia sp.]|nr:insulinase family protein [Puia sp.]
MKFFKSSFLIRTFVCLILSAHQLSAQPLPAQPQSAQPLPLDPAVRTGRLPNGLTYYIRHNQQPKDRALLYLVNKVGSILEDEDQRGLAHFMEHMNFNGTKHYPKNTLEDFLQKAGVRFGADLNASTNYEETVYMLPIPTTDAGMLPKGLGILRDWAQDALLDSTDIAQERGVVLEEERLRLGAGERLQRQYFPVLVNHSRYADRVPIGLHATLTTFRPGQLRRFHHDWYRPDLQAVIVVGDVNVEATELLIRRQFGDLANPAHERPRPHYTIPLTGRNQFARVTDKELSNISLQVVTKFRAPAIKTLAEYRAALVRQLFGQLINERFAALERNPTPPFLEGGAGIGSLMGGVDVFTTTVTARPGALESGFKAAWRELLRIRRHGFTDTELQRARKNYLSGFDEAFREKDKMSSVEHVKEYVQHFLQGAASPGMDREYQLVDSLVPGISLAEVDSLVNVGLQEHDRDIILEAPEKDSARLPDEKTILSWMAAVSKEPLTSFKDETITLPLLKVQPTPGSIVGEEKDTLLQTTTFTLSNGIRVIIKKTDYQNDRILFNGFSDGGTSLYSDTDYESAANAAGLVSLSGVGNYNATQLTRLLTGKQLSVGTYIAERSQGVSGNSSPKDLPAALELLYAMFTEPGIDEAQFNGQLAMTRSALVHRGNDPNRDFGDTVKAVLGNYNIRRINTTLAMLDQIDVHRAYEIYKERFADASGFTFVFVGNIEEETLKPLLETYLASLPAQHIHQQAKDLGLHIPEGQLSRTVYGGKEQKATVLLVLSGAFPYSYENTLRMSALKEVLQIKLLEKLREEESSVYTPGLDINVSKYPTERYAMTVSFSCAPANVERLIKSVLGEIEKLKTTGPSPTDLDKFKAESRVSWQTSIKTNGFWLGYLSGQLLNNEPMHQVFDYDSIISRMTTGDVKELATKCLTGQNFVRLVLLPE